MKVCGFDARSVGTRAYRHLLKKSQKSVTVSASSRHASTTLRSSPQVSYVHGASTTPLRGITVGNLLQRQVEKTPDKEALVFCTGNVRRTFAGLLEQSDRLAAGLLKLGLQKGDRVGIWGPNSLEWVLTQYATARAGMILVNVNPLYKSGELEFALKLVGCKAVICAEEFREQKYYDILHKVVPSLDNQSPGPISSDRLPSLQFVIMLGDNKYSGTLQFRDVMQAASDQECRAVADLQDKLQFDEPINIQFTSGTTGFPKGATLSHHNIVNNSFFVGQRLDYHNRETRICIPVPLYHCFGMVIGSLQMPNHGSTCVFPAPGFDAQSTLQAVSDEKCTSLYGVPTMFIDMLTHPKFAEFDISSLYTGVMAGSPCPEETMRQVIQRMHMDQVTVCYGTTENSPVTFQSFRDASVEKRVTTVGQVHPHIEAKIINEAGEVVPLLTKGELCTRGYTTMLAYWNESAKTAEVVRPDRWYLTGDIGVMDEEGYVRIAGRIKDMIIRGGENVYPLEIEQVLYTHPKVKEVQVVGVPDKRLGEQICACVQLKDGEMATEDEIREFCRDQIASFKVPKYVQFVSGYPMTVTGKIQKFKIREAVTQELGLNT